MTTRAKLFGKVLAGIGIVCYPCVVFLALYYRFPIRWLGIVFLCLLVMRVLNDRRMLPFFVGFGLVLLLLLSNNDLFLRLYPVLMNMLMCATFAGSLRGVPIAERFAVRFGYKMDAHARTYARCVTVAWAIFMFCNTIASGVTVFMPIEYWTIYNGFVSYILIAIMFVGEWIVRKRVL